MVTQQIKLYMDDTLLPDIRMVSGDVGREIVLYVYPNKESTESLDLTTFELRVIYIKPDKTFVIQDYIDGIMDIPTQVGAVVGNGYYQIRLSKAGEEIYSAQGNLIIDDYILNDSMVESVAEVNGMQFPDDFLTIADLSDYATKQYVDDAIADIPDPLDIYSTNEHVVGTFIDGKPVYEKTFYIASPAYNVQAGTRISEPSFANIDKVISINGTFIRNANGNLMSYKFDGGEESNLNGSAYGWVRVDVNDHSNHGIVYFIRVRGESAQDVIITIRYTKIA